MTIKSEIHIYTDGACSGNPGPGGWGAVILKDPNKTGAEHRLELFDGDPETTNNRMELQAAICALEHESAHNAAQIHLFTDSSYVKDGMQSWIAKWKVNGWKSSSGNPVKNQDLWLRLSELADSFDVTWHWVKGHAGHPMNERADYLARHAITQQIMKQNLRQNCV